MQSLADIWRAGTRFQREETSRLLVEIRSKRAEEKAPVTGEKRQSPANDNRPAFAAGAESPDHRERLEALGRRHGGKIRHGALGLTLWGTNIDGKLGSVTIDANGVAMMWAGGTDVFEVKEGSSLPIVDPSKDWAGKAVPERDWFIDDLIPARQVTILAGDGGVGKSLLALQIGVASALGVETAGLEPRAGRCLYLGAEDEEDEFHRRVNDIVRGHGKRLRDLKDFRLLPMADLDALLSVPDKAGVMQPTPLWHDVCDLARSFSPLFIVLDTVADLFGGDEIKRGQARQFIGMLRRLAIEIDCAIVLLAHPSQEGMRSGTGSSGSTGWRNSSRSMLYFQRDESTEADPDVRLLSTKKINYGKVGGELKLRWEAGHFVPEGPAATSPAARMMAKKAEVKFIELLRFLTRTGQNVITTKGSNYAPKVMSDLPAAAGFSKMARIGAMNRLLEDGAIRQVESGPPSKKRKRLIICADDYGGKDGE